MAAASLAEHPHHAIAHLIDLFRSYGLESEETLSALAETYDRARNVTAPVYVAPGDIDGVDAGLILTQRTKKNTVSLCAAIVLTQLADNGNAQLLDHPVLRIQPLSKKAQLDTPDRRYEALRNTMKGSGHDGGFKTSQGYDCPLTNASTSAYRIVSRNVQAIFSAVDQKAAELTRANRPRSFSREAFRKAVYERELKVQRRRYADAIVAFRQHLDPDILELAREAGTLTVEAYNLLAGEGERTKALYRRQAIRAYPVAALELTEKSMAVHHIDNGWPPAESLVGAWTNVLPNDIGPADPKRWTMRNAIRYLHGYTWRHTGQQPIEGLSAWVGRLSYVPKEWVPSDPEGFETMRRVFKTAGNVTRTTHRDFSELIASTSGDWRGFERRRPSEPESGLVDMLRRAWDHLVLPEILRRKDDVNGATAAYDTAGHDPDLSKRLSQAIFGEHGLLKILRANERFHRRLPRLDALTRTYANSGISWPSLSREMVFEDIQIVPLTTPEALIDEGNAMDNCVGGYTENCLNGAHIVSLHFEGGRLATAQLDERVTDKQRYLTISEVRGVSNSPPIKEVDKALRQYVDHLNQPDKKPDFAAMSAHRDALKAKLHDARMQLRVGFDYTDPEAQEAVWQEWRKIIPGPARKARTYDAFLSQSGLDDALRSIFDQTHGYTPSPDEAPQDPLDVMRM